MNLIEAKEKLVIDKNNLDEVLMFQADVFYDVSKEFSEAISRRDDAKMKMDQCYADTDLNTRENWDGDKKPTEKMIESIIQTDPDYQKTYTDYLKAKNEADQWLIMKEAFQQRSSMIKTLGDLYIAGYWTVKTISSADPEIAYLSDRRRNKKSSM